MFRGFRVVAVIGLLALAAPLVAPPGRADVVWNVTDEGPRAPEAVQILGDEARTLAFGPSGDWELRGTTWHPVPLRTTEVVGSERTLFFANGRFGATTSSHSTCRVQLFILNGDTWTRLWSEKACHPVIRSEERLYVVSEAFKSCGCASNPAIGPDARRLRSVSLADGSTREEAPLPACSGTLFALSGKLHLIETPPTCITPGARDVAALASAPPYSFYRLDGAEWTQLPPWDLPVWTFLESTPNSLWVVYGASNVEYVARILTTAGFSDPIPVPRDITASSLGPKPLEWNGRLLATSREVRGNIYLLEGSSLVRMTPESPVTARYPPPMVSVAGNRIYTSADGWEIHVRDGSGWNTTSLLGGPAGAESYRMGETKTFAVRGTRLFRRDGSGWTKLAAPPRSEWADLGTIWRDRPVVRATLSVSESSLFAHDETSDQWIDLKAPAGFIGTMLAAGRDLYVAGPPGQIARLREGSWTVLAVTPLPDSRVGGIDAIRGAGGEVFATTNCGCGPPTVRDEPTYRVDGDRLAPAFTDLDPRMVVRDVVEVEGRTVLLVKDGSRDDSLRAVLVSPSPSGAATLLTAEDVRWAGVDGASGDLLARAGDALLFDGLRFERGRLLRQRGALVPKTIDPEGRFASGDRYEWPSGANARVPLLRPAARVRKNLAAIVDSTGHGGTRYRSELTLANLSTGVVCVAKVYAGAATAPAFEVSLGPGAQRRIADPVPGFVGPLAVEFDGLSDESDAWAAVRVFSPAEGGTAGTSIIGTVPGSFPKETTLLRPVRSPGSRLHLALGAARDGTDLSVSVRADLGQAPDLPPEQLIPAGGFLQVDPDPARLLGSLRVEALSLGVDPHDISRNDLLGYFVRNDGATNDGTVVPFEEPDVLPGRRTRFLPAVVGVTSEHGRYRTELTLGRRERWGLPEKGLTFRVTYRDEKGTSAFPVAVGLDGVVEVPDAGAWLAANGVPVDPNDFAGTLTFSSDRPEGAADLLVTAVVLARSDGAAGDYGVSVPVVNESRWAGERAAVPGLREEAGFRSNLALANPEPDGGPDVTLEVTLHQASDGSVIGALPRVTLPPGQRFQWNRPLAEIGYGGDAWAEVRRVSDSGRFVAYGVVNDNATSDGTLLPMVERR